jgi:uncharacterized protein with PIN domain
MKRPREAVKAELLSEAERLIDELLDWDANTPTPTLAQVEDAVLKMRRELSERAAEVVIHDQESVCPGPGPTCPHCHREMHLKGVKDRQVESRVGCLRLKRAYYYCEHCRQGGFFPLGPAT